MRFMIIRKADKDTEAGVMPGQELLAAMMRYNEEMVKAGVMLAGEGLHPTSKGARVKFKDGRPIVNLSVATSDTWRDKATGERRERTEWHRVVIFNEGLCRVAEQYLKKGSKVYLEGSLQTRKWQDQSGQDKYTTEVVLQGFNSQLTMLDRAGSAGASELGSDDRSDFGSSGPIAREKQPAMVGAGGRGDMDDEIPF